MKEKVKDKIIFARYVCRLHSGFTLVEILVACAILPILVIGLTSAYNSIRTVYEDARQYNEIYSVLSACPELDRGIDYNILNGTTNCYPNNSFTTEDIGSGTVTYTPTVSVTNTSNLPTSDPLQSIPDSKVIQVSVNFLNPFASSPPVQLRMLIARNGLGQL